MTENELLELYFDSEFSSFRRFLRVRKGERGYSREVLRALIAFSDGTVPSEIHHFADLILKEEDQCRPRVNPLRLAVSSLPGVALYQGSLLDLQVDGIVAPTSPSLEGIRLLYGGGIESEIEQATGFSYKLGLQKPRFALHGALAKPGTVILSEARNIKAKLLAHVIAPRVEVRPSYQDEKALRACYGKSLTMLGENGCRTVGIPLLGLDPERYPFNEAIKLAVYELEKWRNLNPKGPLVVLVVRNGRERSIIETEME